MLRERLVLRGRLAEDAGAEPEEQVETLVRRELAVAQDDFGTTRPRPDDRVPHRQGRGRLGRAPHGVTATDVEPVLRLNASREDGPVRMGDVLARPADRGRRHDEREVARRGVVRGSAPECPSSSAARPSS